MKKEKTQATTFRVMDAKGNTINHVRFVENERPADSLDILIEKRRSEAERKRGRWASGYLRDDKLTVVPCDAQGHSV